MEEEKRIEMEELIAEEVEKRVTEGAIKWIPILIQILIAFVISVIVFKFVWGWVVPDLFPGAVDQGLISKDLTWLASLKLALLMAVISGFYDSIINVAKS
jgi:hypothetical protein